MLVQYIISRFTNVGPTLLTIKYSAYWGGSYIALNGKIRCEKLFKKTHKEVTISYIYTKRKGEYHDKTQNSMF
jgi:hypothetical protein